MIKEAIKFADEFHKGQVRKYTGEPYISHPLNVMRVLVSLHPPTSEKQMIAAILHDTVEDTDATLEMIDEKFGSTVKEYVYWLTDKSKPEDGNRATRKEIDRNHIAKAPDEAQVIKLADLIHNTMVICEHDKNFARVYLKEKELLLEVLSPAVKSTIIYEQAVSTLNHMVNVLNNDS